MSESSSNSEPKTSVGKESLIDADRIDALGETSAAIAHELNQPLTAVTNYIKAAQRFLAGDNPTASQLRSAREAMEKAGDQVVRAGTIIRQIRDFLESRESEKKSEDINDLIRQAVARSLSLREAEGIEVSLNLDAAIPPLVVDAHQIGQLFLNLIGNAKEAMAGADRREIQISSTRAGPAVEIVIRDSGPGFSPDIAGRLFQAFATTKKGKLGIGLKICQSIVQGHDGSIRALAEGPGAAFLIRLPLP